MTEVVKSSNLAGRSFSVSTGSKGRSNRVGGWESGVGVFKEREMTSEPLLSTRVFQWERIFFPLNCEVLSVSKTQS